MVVSEIQSAVLTGVFSSKNDVGFSAKRQMFPFRYWKLHLQSGYSSLHQVRNCKEIYATEHTVSNFTYVFNQSLTQQIKIVYVFESVPRAFSRKIQRLNISTSNVVVYVCYLDHQRCCHLWWWWSDLALRDSIFSLIKGWKFISY